MMMTDFGVPPRFDTTSEINAEVDKFVKECTVGGARIPSKTFVSL
jgi:hypothetical protein